MISLTHKRSRDFQVELFAGVEGCGGETAQCGG